MQSANAIPEIALQNELLLWKFSLVEFGHGLYVPALAAQIEQESMWNRKAVSRAKARGPSQFIEKTARWVAEYIDSCTVFEDFHDFACAIPAQIWLMRFNFERSPDANECDQYGFALSKYNGGGVEPDRRLAANHGADPNLWFDNVEHFNGRRRSAANFRENRRYPRAILFSRQRKYAESGYGGGYLICSDRL